MHYEVLHFQNLTFSDRPVHPFTSDWAPDCSTGEIKTKWKGTGHPSAIVFNVYMNNSCNAIQMHGSSVLLNVYRTATCFSRYCKCHVLFQLRLLRPDSCSCTYTIGSRIYIGKVQIRGRQLLSLKEPPKPEDTEQCAFDLNPSLKSPFSWKLSKHHVTCSAVRQGGAKIEEIKVRRSYPANKYL